MTTTTRKARTTSRCARYGRRLHCGRSVSPEERAAAIVARMLGHPDRLVALGVCRGARGVTAIPHAVTGRARGVHDDGA